MPLTATNRNTAHNANGADEEYHIVSFVDPLTGELMEFDLYSRPGMFSTSVVRMLIALGYDPRTFNLDELWNMAS